MTTQQAIQTHRDLQAWQKAMTLARVVYRACENLPQHELYGLTSQLRRGAVAVASNIAEGYGRGSKQDYVRFLKVACGALYELDTQLQLALDFHYMTEDDHDDIKQEYDNCQRLLAGLIRSLER